MLRWFKNKNKKDISAPFTNEEWVELLSNPPNEQAVDELRKFSQPFSLNRAKKM